MSELTKSQRKQAERVMPLIEGLIVEWEGISDELRDQVEGEFPSLNRVMEAIFNAMDGK